MLGSAAADTTVNDETSSPSGITPGRVTDTSYEFGVPEIGKMPLCVGISSGSRTQEEGWSAPFEEMYIRTPPVPPCPEGTTADGMKKSVIRCVVWVRSTRWRAPLSVLAQKHVSGLPNVFLNGVPKTRDLSGSRSESLHESPSPVIDPLKVASPRSVWFSETPLNITLASGIEISRSAESVKFRNVLSVGQPGSLLESPGENAVTGWSTLLMLQVPGW